MEVLNCGIWKVTNPLLRSKVVEIDNGNQRVEKIILSLFRSRTLSRRQSQISSLWTILGHCLVNANLRWVFATVLCLVTIIPGVCGILKVKRKFYIRKAILKLSMMSHSNATEVSLPQRTYSN